MNPPSGRVGNGVISMTIVERQPDAERLNAEFERFLTNLRQHLDWLRPDVQRWNQSIAGLVENHVQARRRRAEQAGTVASGLKFPLKARADRAATFSVPIRRRGQIA